MIKTYSLKAGRPQTVSIGEVRYINLLIAAGEIILRGYAGNSIKDKLDTVLYKGMELELKRSADKDQFTRFELVSAVDQEIKIWLGKHRAQLSGSEMRRVGSKNVSSNQGRAFYGVSNLVASAEPGRGAVKLKAAADVFIGGSNVTVDNGYQIDAGETVTVSTEGALYACSPRPADKLIEVPKPGTLEFQKSVAVPVPAESTFFASGDRIWAIPQSESTAAMYSDDFGDTWLTVPGVGGGIKGKSPYGMIVQGSDNTRFAMLYDHDTATPPLPEQFTASSVGAHARAGGLAHNNLNQMIATIGDGGWEQWVYFSDAPDEGQARSWTEITGFTTRWSPCHLGEDRFIVFRDDFATAKIIKDGVIEDTITLTWPPQNTNHGHPIATEDGRVIYNGGPSALYLVQLYYNPLSGQIEQTRIDTQDRNNKGSQWPAYMTLEDVVVWAQFSNTSGANPKYYAKQGLQGEVFQFDSITTSTSYDRGIGIFPGGALTRSRLYAGEIEQQGGTVVNVLREVN